MRILYLAYASEPGAGSEYGVGWMVPLTMAQQHPESGIYVLTRSRCKEKIEMAEKPSNLHYMFYDIPLWLYYKREMQSRWGEQYNYLLWQWLSRRRVKEICSEENIDIIHHLTFNQYRTPSPGYWLNKPFVVGPIGGAECIARSLWQDLESHTRRKENIRRKGYDLPLFRWLCNRSENKKTILCSSNENLKRLQPYGNGNTVFMNIPAIGITKEEIKERHFSHSGKQLNMVYAGKAWDWKGLHLFLRALRRFIDILPTTEGKETIRLQIIGIRFEEEQNKVKEWLKELQLSSFVTLIPFIERNNLLCIMQDCSLNVYPAFRDSGSMSVLEASALGCPTICLDTGGQDAFPDNILLKTRVCNKYEDTLMALSQKLLWAYNNPNDLACIGTQAQAWVRDNLTWEKKTEQYDEIYNSLL